MKNKDDVLECLKKAHKEKWGLGSHIGSQTSKSVDVTTEWQKLVLSIDDQRYQKEYPILHDNKAKYRIDVVDWDLKIAYELKVSAKNPHHEFYKDIFKVALANKDQVKFKKVYFCVQEAGRKQLGLLSQFAEIESKKLGFDVEIFYF